MEVRTKKITKYQTINQLVIHLIKELQEEVEEIQEFLILKHYQKCYNKQDVRLLTHK